ncbi:MAG TPA: bifunctional 5,10-methylenetetrahydrofolate dehydrogenase/5,10-methenyltetrahydrofolate cyclohydrolase [Candidatus Paceibacterota bacterium]|nr:bifunctional 5,10-methylenetetrahydrofolate dehydrogenase/5,10-methenyltetrahydrofolate cyclohydrolase [Candidatus Paceibacterota bacterium]
MIVDGKGLAREILEGIRTQIDALGVQLQLAAVCVEGDAALTSFVRLKQKAAQSIGIQFSSYFVGSKERAEETLKFLAADPDVHGILLELPIPDAWDRNALLALIPPDKDVDALNPENEGAFEDSTTTVLPPAVVALRYALDTYTIPCAGARAAVIGAGQLIGRPVAHWLRQQGASVDVVDIDTPNPQRIVAAADIVVSGAGAPGLVTGAWIKEGAAVFDFGFHEGKGDVDLTSVQPKAGVLAKVPGGMGPLVVAAVLENLVALATK